VKLTDAAEKKAEFLLSLGDEALFLDGFRWLKII
jgi:hypothetical protein